MSAVGERSLEDRALEQMGRVLLHASFSAFETGDQELSMYLMDRSIECRDRVRLLERLAITREQEGWAARKVGG